MQASYHESPLNEKSGKFLCLRTKKSLATSPYYTKNSFLPPACQEEGRSRPKMCECNHILFIPLHAARTVMAAAPPLPESSSEGVSRYNRIPSQPEMIGSSRALLSPSPHICQTKGKEETQKGENKTQTESPPPASYSSILSGLGSTPSSAPTSPTSPSPWATVASCSGISGAAAPLSRRGGGGDLHPLADKRASLLAAQASARTPWAPPQFAHLAAPCGHGWPLPTLHPTTGHRQSIVRWSFAQRAHLGAAAGQWEQCASNRPKMYGSLH